jgi:hypothetical protein
MVTRISRKSFTASASHKFAVYKVTVKSRRGHHKCRSYTGLNETFHASWSLFAVWIGSLGRVSIRHHCKLWCSNPSVRILLNSIVSVVTLTDLTNVYAIHHREWTICLKTRTPSLNVLDNRLWALHDVINPSTETTKLQNCVIAILGFKFNFKFNLNFNSFLISTQFWLCKI